MASDPCAGCHQYDSTEARNAACADMVPWNAAPPSPTSPTPFLTKTYELVDDPDTDSVISWSNEGTSFVIWNPADLCQRLLPRYFKHSNFASFVRQLNTYGFHKITSDRWEFANVEFKRGQRQLLRGIHRRQPSTMSQPPGLLQADCARSTMFLSCSNMAELCKFDEEEKERLKKDRKKLIKELWSLQQKLQSTMGDLQTMWERLQKGETSLRHTVSFISKAINDPDFLAHTTEDSSTATKLANAVPKKRQLEDIVDDQSALGGIHCSCKNATCAGQHYRVSAKSMDTELSMRVKANWNEMCSVDPAPLKTLDELFADAKLMRSAAMNNNDIPYSRSFMTECAHRHCAADGPLSRQNPDKCYQAVYTRPTRRYGHLTAARDTCTTSDGANDLTYNVASP